MRKIAALLACLLCAAMLTGCAEPPGVRDAQLSDAETVRLLEQFVQWHDAFDLAWGKGLSASVEVVFLQEGHVKYSGVAQLSDKGSCRLALAVMEQQIGGVPVFKAAITQVGVGSSMYTFDVEDSDLRGVRYDVSGGEYGEEEIVSGARLPLYGVFYRAQTTMPTATDIGREVDASAAAVVFYLTIS